MGQLHAGMPAGQAEAGGRVRDVALADRDDALGALRNLEHGIRRAQADQRIGEALAAMREQHHATGAPLTARRGALSFAGGIGACVGQLQHHRLAAGQPPPGAARRGAQVGAHRQRA